MTRARKNPPAPGEYCDATYTSVDRQCNDPAVYLVRWAHKETGEQKHANACGGHPGRIIEMHRAEAEFSREQFRVLVWEDIVARHRAKAEAEAAAKAEEAS